MKFTILMNVICFFFVCSFGSACTAFAEKLIAYTIGNSEYVTAGQLHTPVNDSAAIRDTLIDLGFKVKDLSNSSLSQMKQLISSMKTETATAQLVVFFYAGHGVQINGESFLIPVEAQPAKVEDIPQMSLRLSTIYQSLKGSGAKIVILDACRSNNFSRSSGWGLSSDQNIDWIAGLSEPVNAPSNSLIAYATDPKTNAPDPAGSFKHSYYTRALLEHMQEPGLELRDLFGRVRDLVSITTQGNETPWTSVSLGEKSLYFREPVKISLSIEDADDVVVITMDGEEVASGELNEDRPARDVPLRSGRNALKISVFNQKTYEGAIPLPTNREGWNYKVRLSEKEQAPQQTLHIFSGSEHRPPTKRWGRLFSVSSAVINVDKKTGRIFLEDVHDELWKD